MPPSTITMTSTNEENHVKWVDKGVDQDMVHFQDFSELETTNNMPTNNLKPDMMIHIHVEVCHQNESPDIPSTTVKK